MQSEPHSFILSQKNQQISCWKEMDWGGVWQIGGVVEVDIQRAVSVIPTNGEILSTSAICRTSISFLSTGTFLNESLRFVIPLGFCLVNGV